jgi:SAM-dependent methyltransferase
MPEASARYTHGHHDSVLRSHRWRTAENSAAYLLPLLESGMNLLDVGCGPGTLTIDLAERVSPGVVVGLDIAAAVLDEARRRASERGLANVMFVEGDVRTVALEQAPFDVVHAHQVLHYLDDPVTALGSMAKMTRSGGVVAVREGDYASMVWSPDDPRLDRWLSIYRFVLARNGGNPDGGRLLPRWARAAGLRVLRYTTSTWTFATSDDRAWWGGRWAERVIRSSFADQAIGYGVSDHAELVEIADAWRSWAASPDAVFAMLHGELIAGP